MTNSCRCGRVRALVLRFATGHAFGTSGNFERYLQFILPLRGRLEGVVAGGGSPALLWIQKYARGLGLDAVSAEG